MVSFLKKKKKKKRGTPQFTLLVFGILLLQQGRRLVRVEMTVDRASSPAVSACRLEANPEMAPRVCILSRAPSE